jgi:hypothetical protein
MITGARRGMLRSTAPTIVAPGASCTVELRRGSLWIAPDLWKTHRARFPQGRWTALKNAPPTRSTRHSHFCVLERKEHRPYPDAAVKQEDQKTAVVVASLR